GDSNAIGGLGSGEPNVISGNNAVGVKVSGGSDNFVDGNTIGLGADGTTAVPNQFGLEFLGGASATQGNHGEQNVIAANTNSGVLIDSTAPDQVSGNELSG